MNVADFNADQILFPFGPIKDFIHQNILQAFMDKPFNEAILYAGNLYHAQSYMDLSFYREKYRHNEISDQALDRMIKKYGGFQEKKLKEALFNFTEIIDDKTFNFLKEKNQDYLIKSNKKKSIREAIKAKLGLELNHEVNAILFRLLGGYLDQGISLWPSHNIDGFIPFILYLAKNSLVPLASFISNKEIVSALDKPPIDVIYEILPKIISSPELFPLYIEESLLDHPGWSGMINMINKKPESLAKKCNINIFEMLAVKLAFEHQFIRFNNPFFLPITIKTNNLEKNKNEITKEITKIDLQKIWHEALEETYYDNILKIFAQRTKNNVAIKKQFQAVFCIDDRECSFRRHLEQQSKEIETFSYAGFFSIDFYFKPYQKDILEKLCPVPITPKHLVMEEHVTGLNKSKTLIELSSYITRHQSNSIFLGFVSAYTLGHLSLFRLLLSFLHPLSIKEVKNLYYKKEKTKLIFERTNDEKSHNLYLGFSEEELANRVFDTLKSIGLVKDFAPLIFIIGHKSSSVNNPHFAAYDCGACSGRSGAINARIFAKAANMENIRKIISNKGISIPKETFFVGGVHDTCTDEIDFFDVEDLPSSNKDLMKEFLGYIEVTQQKNAQERCQKFFLVKKNISGKAAMREVKHRATALFEPRPELGHAGNALCIVGRRALTYGMNFDRRAFLQSYDPDLDCDGKILSSILTAVIPVCGGINLDYFFSRIDPSIYGCGSKLSHNICSLIGVGNGLDDDLRVGLPIQMTEAHDPIRLLLIIEQTPEIIKNALALNESLLPWINNQWMRLASIDPKSEKITYMENI